MLVVPLGVKNVVLVPLRAFSPKLSTTGAFAVLFRVLTRKYEAMSAISVFKCNLTRNSRVR